MNHQNAAAAAENAQRSTLNAQRSRKRAAFTLVEMLLVLVILAVLAAIVIPKMSGRSQQAKVTAAGTQIKSLETALDMFEADTGYYPKGLDALLNEPSGTQNWKGPYLKQEVPLDPWGNAYHYTYPGKNNPKGYDLSSNGPDGQPGGDDDITNWNVAK